MGRIRLLIIALAALMYSLPIAATAQGRGIEAGKEAATWSAVGILQVRGGGWCSAALIGPSTVLTAAHCVYPDGKRELFDPARMQFNAGWRDGLTAARRGVVRIVAHRDYDPRKPYDMPNIASDLAIVELDEPIPADVAPFFPIADKIRSGAPVSVVSFSGRRSDVASINDSCSVNSRDGDVMLLSCQSFPGMSGAPVFADVGGRAQVVALISGSQIGHSGTNNGIALAIGAPHARVMVDARATAATPLSALPYWTRRNPAAARQTPVATRRSITVNGKSGLSGLTGSGSARKVIKPPKSSN